MTWRDALYGFGFLALIGPIPALIVGIEENYHEARREVKEEELNRLYGIASLECEDDTAMSDAIDFKKHGLDVRYIPGCKTVFFAFDKREASLFLSFEDAAGNEWDVYQTSISYLFDSHDTEEE